MTGHSTGLLRKTVAVPAGARNRVHRQPPGDTPMHAPGRLRRGIFVQALLTSARHLWRLVMPAGDDVQIHRASSALLLRPDGRVEPLFAPSRPRSEQGYASPRPGRADAASLVAGARSDRRRRRRAADSSAPGRLVDLLV